MPCQDYQAESGRTLDRRCARAAAAEMRNWTVGRSATSPAFDPLANSSRNNSGWTWHAEAAEERREEASVKCSGRKKEKQAGGLFLTDRCHLALAPSLRFVLGVVTRMVSAIFVRVHIMSALLAACR